MARTNGKSEIEPRELDAGHELPASEDQGEASPTTNQGDPEASRAAGEMTAAEAEWGKLKAERDTLLDRLARLQAEFENARKRTAREQQEFRQYALADAVRSLLPVLDSFERALPAGTGEKSELESGMELIYKQLQDALMKLGLRAIPAKGEPFDPRLHQAIEMVETSDAKDQHILEELQRGYQLKDRLLRPAMVKVARNSKP
jgi:molecular chaperone GrpE